MEEESAGVQCPTDNGQLWSPTWNLMVESWLSPPSDHFPTPKGVHFLSAPNLPSSPSTMSADESICSRSTSPNPWNNNRSSAVTDVTEFGDLCDITDQDELAELRRVPSHKASVRRSKSDRNESARRTMDTAHRALPPLVIPGGGKMPTGDWSAAGLKKKALASSPVPPTPPTRVEMSPEVLSFIQDQQAQEVPTISAPPSLDGSSSSEQLAHLSAPPTPVSDSDSSEKTDWTGVRLQPSALATLYALAGGADSDALHEYDCDHQHSDRVLEMPREPTAPEMRQKSRRLLTSRFSHRRSLAELTELDIPSPGRFFSGLSPSTKAAWRMPTKSPVDVVPPTSTTAEQFYRCPWNRDTSVPPMPPVPAGSAKSTTDDSAEQYYRSFIPAVVEQFAMAKDEEDPNEDDMPTARPIVATNTACSSPEIEMGESPREIVTIYDPEYSRKLQKIALSNLEHTELWLMAQRAYLRPVEQSDQTEEQDGGLGAIPETTDKDTESLSEHDHPSPVAPRRRKMVRFSDMISTAAAATKTDVSRRALPFRLARPEESVYYRAFQDYMLRSGKQDVFVHQLPRFEALQAQRACLREAHRNQLLGKYQLSVVPQSARKRLSANVARGDDDNIVLVDGPGRLRREKGREAMSQMAVATWQVAAVRLLNGGELFSAPVAKRLDRLSRKAAASGRRGDRRRILDLGGQSACDWAWHCALQYPNAKVYTVTTTAIRQLSNANVRGPPNHRPIAVKRLTRLPFPDNHFDVVSARELHSILKLVAKNGEDEWDSCLRECLRVLKPGGSLDFSVLDSDMMNPGPFGLAKSVEFGFDLKTLGYDPHPTRMFLARLATAGFENVRRAWLCLPIGARPSSQQQANSLSTDAAPPGSTPGKPFCADTLTLTGSTDRVANVTGIVGGCGWERWLLRCEVEKLSGALRLADTATTDPAMREAGKSIDGIAAIVEEGRRRGAGWRMLSGYARKPESARTGFISVGFAI